MIDDDDQTEIDGEWLEKWANIGASKALKGRSHWYGFDKSDIAHEAIIYVLRFRDDPRRWNRAYLNTSLRLKCIEILIVMARKMSRLDGKEPEIKLVMYSGQQSRLSKNLSEARQLMRQCLSNDDQWETVNRNMDGETLNQISKSRGLPLSTIKSHKIRAYNTLKIRLSGRAGNKTRELIENLIGQRECKL
jgi:DNA-directed RNA polymerase specialized sigma24 family protein